MRIQELCLGILLIALSGCATGGTRDLRGKLWHGDPAHGQIYRQQDGKALKCDDPGFAKFTALLTTDLAAHDKACQTWQAP